LLVIYLYSYWNQIKNNLLSDFYQNTNSEPKARDAQEARDAQVDSLKFVVLYNLLNLEGNLL